MIVKTIEPPFDGKLHEGVRIEGYWADAKSYVFKTTDKQYIAISARFLKQVYGRHTGQEMESRAVEW